MAKKKIGLIGAGNIGGELARLAPTRSSATSCSSTSRRRRTSRRARRSTSSRTSAILGYDAAITGTANWADLAGRRRPHRHRRHPAQAGPVARRPRRDEPADHPRRRGQREEALPRRVRDRHLEPARRDGLRVQAPHRLRRASKVVGMAGVLDSARFQLFLAREASAQHQGRARDGARRPRRRHGAGPLG